MVGRVRGAGILRFPSLCKALGALALCWTVLVPLTIVGTATASAAIPVQTVPNTSFLNGVACSTSTNCVAVGFMYFSPDLIHEPVVVPISNGTAGTAQLLSDELTTSLSAVACPTATSCLAVGGTVDNSIGGGLVVPITNGIVGTPQAVPNVNLIDIACTSSTQCLAVGHGIVSPSPFFLVPITNGTPGTPEQVTASGSLILNSITCLSATDCLATGAEDVPVGQSSQQEGAALAIINGSPGSVVLDSDVTGFGGGTCPTPTSCLFSGIQTTTSSPVVVPIDGNANPGAAEVVPGESSAGAIACPSLPNSCVLLGENSSQTSPDLVPITNGIPGNPVPIPGTSGLSDITCPTPTSCLATGFVQPSNQLPEGVVLPLSMPSTSVGVPSNGATISGRISLDASASSSFGITSVTYELSGGTLSDQFISSSTPTIVGWLGGPWNTTTVPNGTYTLQSVATDAAGFTATSAPVTVTVNNQPPTTAVLIPSGGATLSGAKALLDASASSAAGIASVTYEVSGNGLSDQVVATGTPSLYGYLAQWNTTAVPNGTYTLQSVATNTVAETTTSSPITITVDNPTPSSSVLIPSNGTSVSGTSSVLDASASPSYSTVTYELSGGTLSDQVIATGTPTLYGWLAEWNTTTVPNGSYILVSVAAYPNGVSTLSAPVSISVDNPPPSTTVSVPANGATESSNSSLVMDAVASPGVTKVVFDLTVAGDVFSASAVPTIYGWIGVIPAMVSEAGPPCEIPFSGSIQSVASYSGGVSGTSAPVSIVYVVNVPSECQV